MKEPTMKEVLKLVTFRRDVWGTLYVVDVWGNVLGNVGDSVYGDVYGDVKGTVWGDVGGDVQGTIKGREWDFVETPKEKAIRLIREGKDEEAIKVLQEGERFEIY
jgi:hypothetical protein